MGRGRGGRTTAPNTTSAPSRPVDPARWRPGMRPHTPGPLAPSGSHECPTQLHIGSFDANAFRPVSNRPSSQAHSGPGGSGKPLHGTGTWSTDLSEVDENAWLAYVCTSYEVGLPEGPASRIELKDDAHVLTVATREDAQWLHETYGGESFHRDDEGMSYRQLDFERLSEHYDGLRVEDDAVYALDDFTGGRWDVASTVMFNNGVVARTEGLDVRDAIHERLLTQSASAHATAATLPEPHPELRLGGASVEDAFWNAGARHARVTLSEDDWRALAPVLHTAEIENTRQATFVAQLAQAIDVQLPKGEGHHEPGPGELDLEHGRDGRMFRGYLLEDGGERAALLDDDTLDGLYQALERAPARTEGLDVLARRICAFAREHHSGYPPLDRD